MRLGSKEEGRPRGAGAKSLRRVVVLLAMVVGAALLAAPVAAQAPEAGADANNSDRRCLQCHGQPHIAELGPADRLSMVGTRLETDSPTGVPTPIEPLRGDEAPTRQGLYVKADALAGTPHAKVRCVECHEDSAKLPHAPKLQKSTCATACHAEAAKAYEGGAHHAAMLRKDPNAPTCASCHGGHDILKVADHKARQYKLNSLFLCGDCHKQHASSASDADPHARVTDYLDSAHARGVTKAGLPMAATCADCHGAHGVRASKDPASSVNRTNIPQTCGKCHVGVADTYATSVHGKKHTETNGRTAVCTDCHTAHQITLASSPQFLRDVIEECGQCHDSPSGTQDRVGTYYETYHKSYHGQVTRLGGQRAARCSDCHGAHDIRPLSDPDSMVNKQNLVRTCAKCHPGANASFVKYDPHANHRDAKNFPILHGVWLYFMIMMTSVFSFFGLHTLLWFIRSMVDRIKHGPPPKHAHGKTAIKRFSTLDRINHAFVAITFLGLTATGIPLVFAQHEWASSLASIVGGVEAAGMWHRLFATMLIANFILHFVGLALAFVRRTGSWRGWLFGPNSLLPRWKDATDCVGMFRWFFGLGPRPKLDRWTYWEKFDYWAEVGGSMIIGGSGLLLWFPEIAARVVPGWMFNVAMIVHGYEALLAIGFIFTIHFFNAHLRPDTFPMDPVIFTGSVPEDELREQRPEEYRRLVEQGRLESLRVPGPDPKRRPMMLIVGFTAVGIGLVLLGLILAGGLS